MQMNRFIYSQACKVTVYRTTLLKKHPKQTKTWLHSPSTPDIVSAQGYAIAHTPGLHPAFGPERFDFILHEGFEIVLHRQGTLLQLVTAQLHTHQVTQESPAK